jgi:hypothetical protein
MTDSNVNYNYQTVIQSWDIPVFDSLPEIVPQKEFNYKNIDKISPEFIRNMSMYDVFNDVFVDTLSYKSNNSKNNVYEYFIINEKKNNKNLLLLLIIIMVLILLYLLYT